MKHKPSIKNLDQNNLRDTLSAFKIDSKDLQSFFKRNDLKCRESGIFNIISYYKRFEGFGASAICRILSPNKALQAMQFSIDSLKPDLNKVIKKSHLKKIGSILLKECNILIMFNKIYFEKFFDTQMQMIDQLFSKGSTMLAKFSYFFNTLNKKAINEKQIMNLVYRIDRLGAQQQKVTNTQKLIRSQTFLTVLYLIQNILAPSMILCTW